MSAFQPPELKVENLGNSPAVACSGGKDSMVLLHHLAALCRALDLPLRVFHINHGLRPEAEIESAQVFRFATELACPFHERRLSLARGVGLEARAREARYEALVDMAREVGVDCIHTAHHREDQIETIVMRLSRRSGLLGLRGIPEQRTVAEGVRVMRPLLRLNSSAIHAYAEAHHIPFSNDASNADQVHLRNRLRHSILPAWRARSGLLSDHLTRIASHAEEIHRDIQSLLPLPGLSALCGNSWLAIPRSPLAGLPQRVAAQVVRCILDEHPVLQRSQMTSRLAGALVGHRAALDPVTSLEGGYRLVADRNYVGLNWDPRPTEEPGLDPVLESSSANSEGEEVGCRAPGLGRAFVLNSFVGALRIERQGRAYRRYIPTGRNSEVDLKRILQHPLIPRAARPFWPVLVDDVGIVQVPPHAPARRCSADSSAPGMEYRWSFRERNGSIADQDHSS